MLLVSLPFAAAAWGAYRLFALGHAGKRNLER